jgi:hypothetical protein
MRAKRNHPARHISRQVRRVSCGRRATYRQLAFVARRMKDDPLVRKVLTELLNHLVGIAVRVTLRSAVTGCIRGGGSALESSRVTPIRPKPVSIS